MGPAYKSVPDQLDLRELSRIRPHHVQTEANSSNATELCGFRSYLRRSPILYLGKFVFDNISPAPSKLRFFVTSPNRVFGMASRFDRLAMSLLATGAVGKLGFAWLGSGFDVEKAEECRYLGNTLPPHTWTKLEQQGFCVHHNFLSGTQLQGARSHALSLVNEGRLEDSPNALDVRQDKVLWVRDALAEVPKASALSHFSHSVRLLRGIASELDNSNVEEGERKGHTVPLDLQLACYDGGGAGYRAHRDNATGPSTSIWALGLIGFLQARPYRKRAVTAILYLNDEEWDCERSGGALRVYLGADSDDETGSTATSVVDVAPCGGTLVLFDSRVVLHRVMPSLTRRLALTLWICDS